MFDDPRATILVVDDDETIRGLLALRLGLLGHEVAAAASVDQAIALLEVVEVDAIVSDQSMTGGTGLDLLAYVRRRRPEVPFVLTSGVVSEELEAAACGAGADWVYEKPDLLEALPELFPPVGFRAAA